LTISKLPGISGRISELPWNYPDFPTEFQKFPRISKIPWNFRRKFSTQEFPVALMLNNTVQVSITWDLFTLCITRL